MPFTPTSSDYEAVREGLTETLRAFASQQEPPPPSPGIGVWIAHLFYLKSSLDAGVLASSQLEQDEGEGLRILAEVSRELSKTLRRCPRCGAFTESTLQCGVCGTKFNR